MARRYDYLYNAIIEEKANDNVSFNTPFSVFRERCIALRGAGFTDIEIEWFATVNIETKGMQAMRAERRVEWREYRDDYLDFFQGVEGVSWREAYRNFIADKEQEYRDKGMTMYDGSIDPWQLLHDTEARFGLDESPGGKKKPRNKEGYSELKKKRAKSYERSKGRE